jgi:hypothetical protein
MREADERDDAAGGLPFVSATAPERDSRLSDHPAAYAGKGIRYDPGRSPSLTYEFWEAQFRALYYLAGDDEIRDRLRELLVARYNLEPEPSPDYDIVAWLAGYRSGKTVLGARWEIEGAWRLPGTRWLAMGQDRSKARETTFRVLHEQLPGEDTGRLESDYNGPETSPIVSNYDRKDHVLTLTNGSVIVEGSADKWNRHAGDEFAGVWLDEPSHYHPNEKLFDLLEMLGTRLSADRGPRRQFWSLTGNGYNPAHKILEKQQSPDGEPLGQEIKLLTASVLDNPFLEREVKRKFERQYAGTAREEQALHGGFSASEGLVYSFDRDRHEVNNHSFGSRLPPLDPEYRVYGYDAGFVDPRCMLEIGRTIGDGHLVVLDEFYERKTSLEQLHDEDKDGWLLSKPPGVIAAEHEPEDIEEFNTELPSPWETIRADKSHEGMAKVEDNWLNPRDEDTGKRLPARLYVHERCTNLIEELTSYKEEEIGSNSATDHAADALRYAVMCVEHGDDGLGGFGVGTVSAG